MEAPFKCSPFLRTGSDKASCIVLSALLTWTLMMSSVASARSPSGSRGNNSPSSSSSSSSASSSSAAAAASASGVVTHYSYDTVYNGNGAGNYDTYGSLYGDSGTVVGYPSQEFPEAGDWDGRGQRPRCIDIPRNLSLCRDIGYQKMMLPNLLHHDSLSEVTQQAGSWVPLVNLGCHPHTQVFLCSLFTPVCLEGAGMDREIYPCQTLCESVKESCLPTMKYYGYEWPEMLRCDKFPEDNDMCIKLTHDVKADNNCSACKQPMTYAAIIDNYCRAEFVSRVTIQSKEPRGQDLALHLGRKKRYYKKENITKAERLSMVPIIQRGASCVCDAINDTSSKKMFLIMGSHSHDGASATAGTGSHGGEAAAAGEGGGGGAGELMLSYVVEFKKQDKDLRRAFKDIRKGNVCKSITEKINGENDKKSDKPREKDDGRCIACKMPVRYLTILENYCLADFVLRVKVDRVEYRGEDSDQAGGGKQAVLIMKTSRKNFKKGAITRNEEKAMEPFIEGKDGCACDLVANKNKSRFLIFGTKREDGSYYVSYVVEFDKNDKEFKRGMRAIRKGNACLGILEGPGLGLEGPVTSSSSSSSTHDAGDKGKDKKGKKKKKGKGKKGKKGKKGGKKKRKGKNGEDDSNNNDAKSANNAG